MFTALVSQLESLGSGSFWTGRLLRPLENGNVIRLYVYAARAQTIHSDCFSFSEVNEKNYLTYWSDMLAFKY